MRLTEHMIIARSKESDLSTIRRINLWGCDLTDISIVKKMTNVEILALSVNNLSSLQPLESCIKLQELYLRKNNIQDFKQLLHLRNLPALTHLWLAENPCCTHAGANYRALVLKMLPNLKKLDDELFTEDEIEKANKLSCGEIEPTEYATATTIKEQPKVETSPEPYEQMSPSKHVNAEQNGSNLLNKPNSYEPVMPQQLTQTQPIILKDDSLKFEDIQPTLLELSTELPQPPTPHPQELPQHLKARYSLPINATSRSDNSTIFPYENQQLNPSNRSLSFNQLTPTNFPVHVQHVQHNELLELDANRSMQIEQTLLQLQSNLSQNSSTQTYQMQQDFPQQIQSPMQNSPVRLPIRVPPKMWQQQDTMQQIPSMANQQNFSTPKKPRCPVVSNLDISQATELDLALKIPRSFSMQTINEHPEWVHQGCLKNDALASLQTRQRISNIDANYSHCRDNLNVNAQNGVDLENWDDGSQTSRTRVILSGANRDINRHEMSRSNRGRLSQNYQRDTFVEDGAQTARTRVSQSTFQDYDGEDESRSYRTGTTLSSRNLRRRNMNVLSALLCIVPELDLESLQVLEHNIVCRIDELSSN